MNSKDHISREAKRAREELIERMRALAASLTHEADKLEKNPQHRPRSMGYIQGAAPIIDAMCGEVAGLETALAIVLNVEGAKERAGK